MSVQVSEARPIGTTGKMGSVLVLNGGSSSIRFAIYNQYPLLELRLKGKLDRIGTTGANLTFSGPAGDLDQVHDFHAGDQQDTVELLLDWLEAQSAFSFVEAGGHRVVHGFERSKPERVTPKLLDELRGLTESAPAHMPLEIRLLDAVTRRHPDQAQVACFDTAFHRTMPRVASVLPIPRRYEAEGIRRYGFHGLSYEYLIEELARLGDPAAENGRVILAHLGSGASIAAVRDGRSIDTSMGFTPASGLVMGARSGDLDPGLFSHLARSEGMCAAKFQQMVNHESGLLGISETSPDLRELLARETLDFRAAEAIAIFCYQAKKWIGSFAAALGGIDTLVFSGGIGENAPVIRERICSDLGFLGVKLDDYWNAANAPLISSGASRVGVRVIETDEELMIARSVMRVLRPDPRLDN
jgi:acetate kinase